VAQEEGTTGVGGGWGGSSVTVGSVGLARGKAGLVINRLD
jgi:hypothetical protein